MRDELFGIVFLSSMSVGGVLLALYLNKKGFVDLSVGCLSASVLFIVGVIGCILSMYIDKRVRISKEV